MEFINIIINQKTNYHIVHSKESTECERYACSELQKYLYQSLNYPVPIFSDKCQKRGPEILIGNARNNNYMKLLEGKTKEAFLIKEVDENIIITGNSPRAILYGVYKFLEEFIGFRCFTKDCETYEKLEELKIKKHYELIQDFSFEYREVYFRDAFDGDFASKNMLNSNMAFLADKHGNKVKWFNFHHSFSDLLNPNEYFDTHPEYFSLVDGKRQKEHTELCLSNEDVYKIALEKVRKWIIDNPECDVFSVAQDEWMGHFIKMACECDECKKIDEENNSQSGSIITFVNKIAEVIKKEFPNKLIHTFAYQYSRKTPTKVIPNDNVIVRLCNIECSWSRSIEESKEKDPHSESAKFYEDLLNWSKITKRLYIWDYAVNFRNYLLPFPNLRTIDKNIKLYKKLKVQGVLMQGNFSHGGGGYLDELKSYVTARLLRDDSEELDVLIKEFCDNYYGKNISNQVIAYINLWEDHVKNFDMWLYDDADHPMFDEVMIDKSLILLKDAYQNADLDKKMRVEKLLLGIEYLRLVRLELDYPNKEEKIEQFRTKLLEHKITEIFERTALDYSIDVMKNSRYAKDRPNWYSLYYIMK
ncbi:MAG: DUF4838 domain-containing protein [Bacilli bacterium]|nr:DUF4838 domain-containing protein [Bacilli bacterium]